MIDGGCFTGHDLATGFEFPIQAVLAEFRRYGVKKGLLGSYRSIYQDVHEGNREVAHWANKMPQCIVPVGIINPVYYGQPPESQMRWLSNELGFQIAGVFSSPCYHPVDWNSPAVFAVGQAAGKLGMTLQAGISTESELGAVARAWGNLQVPVMVRWMAGHRYRTLASEIVVSQQCPNFLFDVGNMSSTGLLELAAREVGAERLFMASNIPQNIAACPHVTFHEAQLKLEDRQLIAEENLTKILELEADSPEEPGEAVFATRIWKDLRSRTKVDIHWHVDHWNMGETKLSDSDQTSTFDRYGYEKVIGSSVQALNYDLETGNSHTASWCEHERRRSGLIVVNPLRVAQSLSQIDEYAEHPDFVGIKTIQDVFDCDLDDRRYEPILEKAAQKGLAVMAHMPGMDGAARRHPEITFVATHANWGRAQRFFDLPNVHFDFSTGHAWRHETQLRRFIEAAGVTRVLFGSDGQAISPAWSLSKLMDADLSPEEEDLVLRRNSYRVFPKLSQKQTRS